MEILSSIQKSPIGYALFAILQNDQGSPSDFRYIEVNQHYELLSGLAAQQLIGNTLSKILKNHAFSDVFDLRQFLTDSVLNNKSKSTEYFFSFTSRWYWINAYIPETGYIIATFYETTQQMKERVQSQKTLMDLVPSPIYYKDMQGRYNFCNRAFEQFFEKESHEIIGKTIYDIAFKDYADAHWKKDLELMAGPENTQTYELDYTSPKGISRSILYNKALICDENGEKKGIVGVITDISEKRRIEMEREYNLKRYETLVSIFHYPAQSIQEMLDYTLHEAIKLTQSKIGYIYYYSEEKKEFTLNTWSKDVMAECKVTAPQSVYQLDKTGIWGEAVRQRKPIVVNDFEKPNHLKKGYPEGHVKLKKFLTVPVFDKGKIVSVVGVANKETDYDQADVLQLELLMENVWRMTERIRAEKELEEQKERLRVTLVSVGDGIICTDKEGRVTMLNQAAEHITGWQTGEASGHQLAEIFDIYNEADGEKQQIPLQDILHTGSVFTLGSALLKTRNGAYVPVADSAAPILNNEGHILGIVLVFRDVTQEQLKQNQILHLSYHDSLTELKNRRYFEEQLSHAVIESNLPISVIIGDVNGLKLTNDVFGHAAGDQLLIGIAGILKNACRGDDLVARWGGDEFIMLLKNTSASDAKRICERIRELCANARSDKTPLSISLGYYTMEKPGENIQNVINRAEDYMYRRKLAESPAAREAIVKGITKDMYENSVFYAQHADVTAKACRALGLALHLGAAEADELWQMGFLHDIGLAAVDREIINKNGPLTKDEWREIKGHPEAGYRIVAASPEWSKYADFLLMHHEKLDGTGYPQGLTAENIPLQARILSLADAYAAMAADRPYRNALSQEELLKELKNNAGTQFDPQLVDLFIQEVWPALQ